MCLGRVPPAPAPQASRLDPPSRRLHRRRGLLQLPSPARRARRSPRPRLGAPSLPADPPRPAGPLRGPGPLRRLRPARRRHPRAAGRVPRRRRLAQPEKPFDTGDAYSPIDFDSFSRGTLDRFPYVITSRAAWNSKPPPNFKRIAATASYVLWKQTGADAGGPPRPARGHRGRRLRGLRRARDPDPPRQPRPRLPLPRRRDRPQRRLGRGQRPRRPAYRDLAVAAPARGQLEPLAAVLLPLRPDALGSRLRGRADGRARRSAPEHDQPRQQRPVLARRPLSRARAGRSRFTVEAADASTLQSLTGYDGKAYVGELVAVPAEPHRTVPLGQACNGWLDWYEADEAP